MYTTTLKGWILPYALLITLVAPLALATDDDPQRWQFEARVFGWLPDLDGNLNYALPNGSDSVSVDISDILDSLEFAFMGSALARRGDWSILTDLIYLDVANDRDDAIDGPFEWGPGANINTDLDLDAWVWLLAGGYRVYHSERADVNLLLGLRMFSYDSDAKLTLEGPLPPTLPPAKLSKSDTLWDGIIGARGRIHFNDRWFMPYYIDVGTGDSRLTWQGMAGVGYNFDWGALTVNYRHLYYDQSGSKLIDDLTFSGPEIGLLVRF